MSSLTATFQVVLLLQKLDPILQQPDNSTTGQPDNPMLRLGSALATGQREAANSTTTYFLQFTTNEGRFAHMSVPIHGKLRWVEFVIRP
ncbi:hypothetical protein CLV31_1291 [Algoriphagus aquaeductus]|uniref:Uncharacterized protein n=1 Tax=Algoriphagus aquaeductus TaxID=475299 RepID=A0A326RUI1_9BACT|nr:hypothetical protein CLV31_1291 [Algoriphagus aquaeductus]